MNSKSYNKVLALLEEGISLKELCGKRYKRGDIAEIISKIRLNGYEIDYVFEDGTLCLKTSLVKKSPYKEVMTFDVSSERFSIAVVSDTHIKTEEKYNFDDIWTMYKTFRNLGVSHVFHLGDVLDQEIFDYKDNTNESRMLIFNNILLEVDNLIKNYPFYKNINTYYIKGNHDNRLLNRYGIDLVEEIMDKRLDFVPLGSSRGGKALVKVNDMSIALDHPFYMTKNRLYEYDKDVVNFYEVENIDIILRGHLHIQKSYFYNGMLIFYAAPFIKTSYCLPSFYVFNFDTSKGNVSSVSIASYFVLNDKTYKVGDFIYDTCKDYENVSEKEGNKYLVK